MPEEGQLTLESLESQMNGEDNPETVEVEVAEPESETEPTEGGQPAEPSEPEKKEQPLDKSYTNEEFKTLLKKSPLHMDRTKVPQEYLDVYDIAADSARAMQADYTRKTMELSEQRKRFEAQKLTPEEQFYEEYIKDPYTVSQNAANAIKSLKGELRTAKFNSDYEKEAEIQGRIDVVEDALRGAELKRGRQLNIDNSVKLMEASLQAEIVKDIPDYFNERINHVSKHLTNEGIDNRLVGLIAYPPLLDSILKANGIYDIDGVQAAKQIIMFANKAYDRANAAVSAAKKEVKKIPHTGSAGNSEIAKPASQKAESAKSIALQDGNIESWADYLVAKAGG